MSERADDTRPRGRSGNWDRVKVFTGLAVTAFAVALAMVIGQRLSDEALAVLAGAVCGVSAAIPTSLLIVAAMRRREEQADAAYPRVQPPPIQATYPPVIVVAPPGVQQQWPNAWRSLPPSLSAPGQRQFTVVGGAPTDSETPT